MRREFFLVRQFVVVRELVLVRQFVVVLRQQFLLTRRGCRPVTPAA
ncbi:hypothetical protein ACIRG4_06400 [Streptomyces sp. NPDC102395]